MRKGISFTLTIIITAVVLMTAALTLVTLFGSSVGSFFGAVSDTSTDARIKQECSSVLRQIDREVCSKYVSTDFSGQATPDDVNSLRSGDNNVTCDEAGCGLNNIDQFGISTEIDIDGDTYDCEDQGYIPNNCPVSDAAIY